jgi:Nucleotidyltransferase domain
VLAVALLGSYARDQARPASDVDLIVIASDPKHFRHQTHWVYDLPWEQLGVQVFSWADEDYGAVCSRRFVLSTGLNVEVGFAAPSWAAIDPADAGTQGVVRGGMWILLDPSGLLNHLLRAVNDH